MQVHFATLAKFQISTSNCSKTWGMDLKIKTLRRRIETCNFVYITFVAIHICVKKQVSEVLVELVT